MAFTPQGMSRIGRGAADLVREQLVAARENLEDDTFTVNSLFDERVDNLMSPAQTYAMCAAKEVLCVVGGDQRVYTCCTLAFNAAGLIGSIADKSFRDLWWAAETVEWFENHDARAVCQVPCLYEKRNKTALSLMAKAPDEVSALRGTAVHINYL